MIIISEKRKVSFIFCTVVNARQIPGVIQLWQGAVFPLLIGLFSTLEHLHLTLDFALGKVLILLITFHFHSSIGLGLFPPIVQILEELKKIR